VSKQTEVVCAWCGKTFNKPLKRFNRTVKLGKQHTCSPRCSSHLTNEQRRSAPSTRNAEQTRQDKELYPEKNHARLLVRQAIKSGKIEVPSECEFCYEECKLDAHHPDHSRPFFLIFLCKKCHKIADLSDDKWCDLASDRV